MENENMEQDESILTLTDENGQDMDFEYLDSLTYEGKEYLVLMPADEPSTEIVILEVEPVDEDNENYLAVEDEAILDAVYGLFKEKNTDILTFEEEYAGPARPARKKAAVFGLLFQASGAAIAMSRTTSPARISPAVPGTKAELPGIWRLPRAAASASQPVGVRASSLE